MTDDFCVLRGAKVTLRDNSCVTVNSPWLKCSKDKKLQKHVNCVTGGEDFISMDRHEQALPLKWHAIELLGLGEWFQNYVLSKLVTKPYIFLLRVISTEEAACRLAMLGLGP